MIKGQENIPIIKYSPDQDNLIVRSWPNLKKSILKVYLLVKKILINTIVKDKKLKDIIFSKIKSLEKNPHK
jgi:hypothetical protein